MLIFNIDYSRNIDFNWINEILIKISDGLNEH